MMVNFAEVSLPDAERRELAKGAAKPDLLERKGSVRCPVCKGWRPPICVVLTNDGWACDGCVSDKRRRGVFEEW
jgi:hypothetical protein